jgi:hypothetical protein
MELKSSSFQVNYSRKRGRGVLIFLSVALTHSISAVSNALNPLLSFLSLLQVTNPTLRQKAQKKGGANNRVEREQQLRGQRGDNEYENTSAISPQPPGALNSGGGNANNNNNTGGGVGGGGGASLDRSGGKDDGFGGNGGGAGGMNNNNNSGVGGGGSSNAGANNGGDGPDASASGVKGSTGNLKVKKVIVG